MNEARGPAPAHARRTWAKVAVALALPLVVGMALGLTSSLAYRSSAEFHHATELVGTLLGLLAGYALVARFLAGGPRVDLALGLAFTANAASDLAHGLLPLAVERGWIGPTTVDIGRFSPASFAAGRFMLAILLLLAVTVPAIREGTTVRPAREARWGILLTASAMIVLSVLTFELASPRAVFEDALIPRPADLLVAAILMAALWRLLVRPLQIVGVRWIVASVILGIVGEATIAFSRSLYDAPFDLGHGAKFLSYFAVTAGFIGGQVRVLARERHTVEALRRTDQARTDFVNTVSHELRTPLTAIRGFAWLLEENPPEAERLDHVERIQRNAHLLQNLIEDALAFSRIDTDQLSMVLRPTSLVFATDAAMTSLGSLIGDHVVNIEVGDARVIADERLLGQVLRNLIANAVHYSPEGTAITIRTETAHGRNRTRILVEDEGSGVAASEREAIFDRFQRGDAAVKSGRAGAGVGLAVVKALMNGMAGTVHVESADGGGARFVLELPAA